MTLTADVAVHTVKRIPRSPDPKLPRIDVDDHRPGLVDVVGATIRDRGWWVIAGVVIGIVIALFASGDVVSAAIAGAVGGFVLAFAVSQFLGLRLGPHRTDIPIVDVVPETLRVMEFNVHGGMGGPGKFFATRATLDHLAAAIAAHRPDVVLLQELDDFAVRSNGTDTLARLARRLTPTGAVMAPAAEKGYGRREGTGILTLGGITVGDARGLRIGDPFGDGTFRRLRWSITMWLGALTGGRFRPFGPVPEYQPRGACEAMIRTPAGNEIRVVSGHFSSPHDGVDEPARQVAPVAEILGRWRGPTIVGADFNVRDGSPEFAAEHERFDAAGLIEATAGAPANSDRIYASAHFAATDARKHDTPPGESPASDHAPVTVDLHLR
ncbi:endonuclease/exonuclease/phosphatase family protein [Williamsia sp. M5A3_1d]